MYRVFFNFGWLRDAVYHKYFTSRKLYQAVSLGFVLLRLVENLLRAVTAGDMFVLRTKKCSA